MAFNFTKINRERLFNVDTQSYDYMKLEELYKRDGEGTIYPVLGLYIGTKSDINPEEPVIATDEAYVNLPVHQLTDVKTMLADKRAIAAINNNECGFVIEKYEQKRYNRTCYTARWVNYNEATAEEM